MILLGVAEGLEIFFFLATCMLEGELTECGESRSASYLVLSLPFEENTAFRKTVHVFNRADLENFAKIGNFNFR